MTALNKQALLRAAVKVGAHTWEAEGSQVWSMSNGKADSLVLEVFGDETSGQQDCDIASFIAEASPANVLMLLDELSESQACKANESDCADSTINLAINWQMRCKDAEAKLEAADKRIAELEARDINIKRQAQALFEAIVNPNDCYIPAYVRCLREALNGNSTGIGVKVE